ncbi:MAG: hypothetical protein HQL66_14275 [Magnetococcales bacterium]|nr:hypothetical protein [Magnetococcales bacterium]
MKTAIVLALVFGITLLSGSAGADADDLQRIGQCMKMNPSISLTPETVSKLCGCAEDMKWIMQCERDNASAQVPAEVVSKYCYCMNEMMDENETKTITEWEKTHLLEATECNKQAGWKR